MFLQHRWRRGKRRKREDADQASPPTNECCCDREAGPSTIRPSCSDIVDTVAAEKNLGIFINNTVALLDATSTTTATAAAISTLSFLDSVCCHIQTPGYLHFGVGHNANTANGFANSGAASDRPLGGRWFFSRVGSTFVSSLDDEQTASNPRRKLGRKRKRKEYNSGYGGNLSITSRGSRSTRSRRKPPPLGKAEPIQRRGKRRRILRAGCVLTRLKTLACLLISLLSVLDPTTPFISGGGGGGVSASPSNWAGDGELSGISGSGPNTTYISQVLNRLTDRSKYDKRLRPRYGEGSVDVGISIHVSSISAVSEVDMDFTLDFYLRQTWHDPRLAFGKLDLHGFERIKSLTVGVDYLDRLWKPDTFFPNEKKSFFHTATTHNSFLRIEPDGRVFTSQRLTVTATCPMQLRLFPMDSQACKLEIESYGYTTDDISYYWGERKDDQRPPAHAVAFADFALPQFRRTGFRVNITKAATSSGVYDRLYIEVILSRNLGFYLMNIIIPSMLIVSISWVSFWLSREASPARVGLGVTTVLTMTTLITTTNNTMPKVSYIKGLDVFLNFCFVMVFASLVEYAVVSYWNKRQCRMRERRRKRGAEAVQAPPEIPMFTNYPTTPTGGLAVTPPPPAAIATQNYVYRAPGLLVPAATGGAGVQSPNKSAIGGPSSPNFIIAPDCDCRTIPLMQYNDAAMAATNAANFGAYTTTMTAAGYSGGGAASTSSTRRRRWRMAADFAAGAGASGGGTFGGSGSGQLLTWCCRRFSPSKIDRCSRSMFPAMFIGFNICYWSIMTLLSQYSTNQQDFVAF